MLRIIQVLMVGVVLSSILISLGFAQKGPVIPTWTDPSTGKVHVTSGNYGREIDEEYNGVQAFSNATTLDFFKNLM